MTSTIRKFVLLCLVLVFVDALDQNAGAISPNNDDTLQLPSPLYLPRIHTPPDTFYVSKFGNNGGGTSWETAWNELDQIDWSRLEPGNTVVLDGGTAQMVYNTTLDIEDVHGTPNAPITIRLSEENGRNGQAILFGGRSTPLPYCDQSGYAYESSGVNSHGIYLNNASYVHLDGTKRSGIVVHGNKINGMRFDANTANITVRYLEVFDNGFADESGGKWSPDGAGIRLAGPNHTFERMIVHDNGQDAFQSGSGLAPDFNENNLRNLTIRESWLYNGRPHPTVNESFNYCAHADGLQIYNGGDVKSIILERAILGPGLTNSLILGQTPTSSGLNATVDDVIIRHVLFMKPADNNIRGYARTNPDGWIINNVTGYCPQTKGHCAYLEGTNHTVTDSIFVGAAVTFPDELDTASGNCQWDASGDLIGLETDPQFLAVDGDSMFSLDNYTVNNASCHGSDITTVTDLLFIMDN